MSISTTDPVFQECRISSFIQHFFVIIRFQEGSVTLFEIMHELLTGCTDIRKNSNICFGGTDHKTMGVAGIMFLLESRYLKSPDRNGLLGGKMHYILSDFPEPR